MNSNQAVPNRNWSGAYGRHFPFSSECSFKWLAWTSIATLPTLCPLKHTAGVSARVLIHIFIFHTVFLLVALDLHGSVASDKSKDFVQTPRAGKAPALGHWSAYMLRNTVKIHSAFTLSVILLSVMLGECVSPVSKAGVDSCSNLPFSLSQVSRPHSVLSRSTPHCCWDFVSCRHFCW